MITIDEVIDKWSGTDSPYINKQDAKEAIKEYARNIVDEAARVCMTDDCIQKDIMEIKNRIQ